MDDSILLRAACYQSLAEGDAGQLALLARADFKGLVLLRLGRERGRKGNSEAGYERHLPQSARSGLYIDKPSHIISSAKR